MRIQNLVMSHKSQPIKSNPDVETLLNKLLCGYRKAHSTQHTLLIRLQKWQKELDSSGIKGTILINLSKAYDC